MSVSKEGFPQFSVTSEIAAQLMTPRLRLSGRARRTRRGLRTYPCLMRQPRETGPAQRRRGRRGRQGSALCLIKITTTTIITAKCIRISWSRQHEVFHDPNAGEIARAWITNGHLRSCLHGMAFGKAETWGHVLAGIAQKRGSHLFTAGAGHHVVKSRRHSQGPVRRSCKGDCPIKCGSKPLNNNFPGD